MTVEQEQYVQESDVISSLSSLDGLINKSQITQGGHSSQEEFDTDNVGNNWDDSITKEGEYKSKKTVSKGTDDKQASRYNRLAGGRNRASISPSPVKTYTGTPGNLQPDAPGSRSTKPPAPGYDGSDVNKGSSGKQPYPVRVPGTQEDWSSTALPGTERTLGANSAQPMSGRHIGQSTGSTRTGTTPNPTPKGPAPAPPEGGYGPSIKSHTSPTMEKGFEISDFVWALSKAVNDSFCDLTERLCDRMEHYQSERVEFAKALSEGVLGINADLSKGIVEVEAEESSPAADPKSVEKASTMDDTLRKSASAPTAVPATNGQDFSHAQKQVILGEMLDKMEKGLIDPISVTKFEMQNYLPESIRKSLTTVNG